MLNIKVLSAEFRDLGSNFGTKMKLNYAHNMWHVKVYDINGHGVEVTSSDLSNAIDSGIVEYEKLLGYK